MTVTHKSKITHGDPECPIEAAAAIDRAYLRSRIDLLAKENVDLISRLHRSEKDAYWWRSEFYRKLREFSRSGLYEGTSSSTEPNKDA